MVRRSMPYALILFLALQGFALAGIKVNCTIRGADGKPPALAHVHVAPIGQTYQQAFLKAAADSRGKAEIQLEKPGYYTLWITAVNHYATAVPLIASRDGETIELQVTPEPCHFKTQFDSVKIIGDWNQFKFSTASWMTPRKDGTFFFEAEAKADTLAYQVMEIETEGHSINGTLQDYYVYDGGGDYRSVLKTKPGQKVGIVFDPSKLPHFTQQTASVAFDAPHQRLAELFKIRSRYEAMQQDYLKSVRNYRQTHKDIKKFSYDASPYLDWLRKQAQQAKDPDLRDYANLHYLLVSAAFSRPEPDSATVSQVVRAIPPETPLWNVASNIFGMIFYKLGKEKAREFAQTLLEKNPSRGVQANMLAFLTGLAKQNREMEKWRALYRRLKENYSDIPHMKFHLTQLNPESPISPGKPVPDFEVTLMGSGEKVSNRSLLGKFYLLDFWATWCGPCVGEMPNLHKAWERFKDRNFVILSLSLDRKPEDVQKFRKEKWNMPWLHAFLGIDYHGPVTKAFEVIGIPKPVLVGPDGKILAVEGDLRGDKLEKTLEKFLGGTASLNE